MHIGLKLLLTVFLIAQAPTVAALELFGVALESVGRVELREAARKAGMVLIREGGNDNWFDVYDSKSAFVGSVRFYLGFVKHNQGFAFAEYEFNGLMPGRILRDLMAKYGAAQIRQGRFVSDQGYLWKRDGVEIRLDSDWQAYKTRLSYINPPNMADLLAERSASIKTREPATERISLY